MSEGGSSPTTSPATGPADVESVLAQAMPAIDQVAGNGHPVTNGASTATDPARVRQVEHASPKQHVTLWLIGVLLASLIPLLVIVFHGLDEGSPPSIFKLLGNGDLLLISLVVTVAGITELVLAMRNIGANQLTTGGIALLSGILAIAAEALWYADLAARLLDGERMSAAHMVTYGSLFFFSLSAFSSSICVWLAAGTVEAGAV